jgi:hypothetical protein
MLFIFEHPLFLFIVDALLNIFAGINVFSMILQAFIKIDLKKHQITVNSVQATTTAR